MVWVASTWSAWELVFLDFDDAPFAQLVAATLLFARHYGAGLLVNHLLAKPVLRFQIDLMKVDFFRG